ncbi:hypothetical protein AMEX_G21929, partial [Astyanax mexicanus]
SSSSSAGLITVDDRCRSDQSCVFYGAVGRPLYLQLPKEDYLQLKKINSGTTSDVVFLYRNKKIRINHLDQRWEFNNETKTMIITRAEKEDSGRYRLDSFNSTGFNTGPYSLHLIIEAGVSSVKMTNSCFSITERKVHCSSDGDQIQFSWTLDGIPHNQNLTDGNQTLLLGERSTGNFTCTVKNHVSNGSATVIIEPCPEALLLWFSLEMFVLVWVLEIIVLLALLGGFHIYGRIFRKRSIKRNSRSAESLITVDDQCRSDQSCVFYGAVGRPLYLQLPDEEELKLFTIKSDYYSDRILHFKNKIIIGKPSDPRWEFNTENKTMIITRAEKKDSARYRLHTYNSTGTNTGIYYLQLIIEAVVSSVEVMDSCSSIMERRVNCSSDGDQIQFSWTLSGTTSGSRLTDGNQTLLLDKDYTGNVTCYVKNYVSSGSKTIELQQCPGKINLIFTELICTGEELLYEL